MIPTGMNLLMNMVVIPAAGAVMRELAELYLLELIILGLPDLIGISLVRTLWYWIKIGDVRMTDTRKFTSHIDKNSTNPCTSNSVSVPIGLVRSTDESGNVTV